MRWSNQRNLRPARRRHLLLLLAVIAGGCADPAPPTGGRHPAKLVRVVDGDTIVVRYRGVEERVRYIGVDTPERDERCFVEATRVNEELLDDGPLTLEFDREMRDRYERLLAYVRAGKTFVNLELLERRVADPLSIEPNTRHAIRFALAGSLRRRCASR